MAPSASPGSDAPLGPPLAQLTGLAIWVGAALLFSGVVARVAFDVLPTRELAGALVGRILPVIFLTGLVAGVGVIALELRGPRRPFAILRGVGAGIMVFSCTIAQLGIAPRIADLRAALPGPLAEMPLDHPARIAFTRLHMLSVAWLAVAILAAVAVGVFAAMVVRPRAASRPRSG
jgi:hypothetical protein